MQDSKQALPEEFTLNRTVHFSLKKRRQNGLLLGQEILMLSLMITLFLDKMGAAAMRQFGRLAQAWDFLHSQ